MQCVRCGAAFEGRFCPRCGAAAVAGPPAPTGWPCPRCGTLFVGNFCPRCGLPIGSWGYPAVPRPSGGRSVLSVLWTLALVGFIVFALTDFAGLFYSPASIVPGIEGIDSGGTVNSGVDFTGNWTANSWGTGSSLSYQAAGGNPGGYLQMTLPSSGARGYWMQSFLIPSDSSQPYTGAVRLDVEVSGGLTSGWLVLSVVGPLTGFPPDPDPKIAIGAVPFFGPSPWTTTPKFYADARLGGPGQYYLQVGFIANATTGPVNVGFDNLRLAWTTDAGVVLYIPAPAPFVVVVTQDKSLFIAYYAFVVGAILLATGYYLVRGWNDGWGAFRAPLEAIGRRLKSHSAWIAIAQVWMAATFFQFVFYYLVLLAGITPTTPINITNSNAWVWLFELANAGVYEEIVFRMLLIGVPMAVASAIARIIEVRRNGAWNRPGSASRHIAGAWRYLIGGALRNDSPREALGAAWILLFASSAVFGLAHAPGWGWWKVVPAMVAGLGFGYLFLRHGIGAAMLAHFVNDFALSLTYEGVGGDGLAILIELLVFGLAVAGAGFFAWYVIDAWNHAQALLARFRPPSRAGPTAIPPTSYSPSFLQPVPAPPTPGPSMPPPPTWAPNPTAPGPGMPIHNPARIPREYTPTYVPPPYGYPPVRFQCPSCGWVEARYDAGRFTCTRCGRTA